MWSIRNGDFQVGQPSARHPTANAAIHEIILHVDVFVLEVRHRL
jgi:hypothetical protein